MERNFVVLTNGNGLLINRFINFIGTEAEAECLAQKIGFEDVIVVYDMDCWKK